MYYTPHNIFSTITHYKCFIIFLGSKTLYKTFETIKYFL